MTGAIVSSLAQDLVLDEPALLSSLDFGPFVKQGREEGPRLILGDQAGIALYEPGGERRLDYRMALLARVGDTLVVRRRSTDFERYLADFLGKSDVDILETKAGNPSPVARQCREDPVLFDHLRQRLAQTGGLSIDAYMTTGHTWRLAQALSDAEHKVVHVAGPGPRIATRCNDKLWFTSLAARLLGRQAVPPTMYAYGPAAAAGCAARFAGDGSDVVVKVPSSAGSAGNIRIDNATLRALSLSGIRRLVMSQLRAAGWQGGYPILVGVWERDVIRSPSAQLWLPLPDDGPPELLGLFEQRVVGPAGTFTGASPAALPAALVARMRDEALALAGLMQRIGYFGPMSLDSVIRRAGSGDQDLHWIECNGRWSGVSIPLAAARTICGGASPGGIVILQDSDDAARPACTSRLCEALDGVLFRAGGAPEGLVLLSPPEADQGISVNVMAIASEQTRAEALMTDARQRLARHGIVPGRSVDSGQ